MNNPKLKRATGTGGVAEKPAKVIDHTNVQEQPKPGKIEKEVPPLRQKYVDDVTKLVLPTLLCIN
ncbi:MAG TPA: hypothetical protein PK491_13705 [Candidatus Hydrogenedentes bacterium]|jgi:hypothetical protein|nr:hypothetical protein [Candidatus Hydrogenedentota bacterium]